MSLAPYRIVGASLLAPFRPGHDYRPAMDEAQRLGFNLLRVFCGPLPWCGQELKHVYERLPGLLDDAQARGLHAYLSYCTEAGLNYDLDTHVGEVDWITTSRTNVLREVANEPWHPTQGGLLSPERCRKLAQRIIAPSGYGAAEDDESLDYAGGDFAPVHLDRGRDKWNMVRRVREVYGVTERTGKPAFNQEPIGAAEASIPGKREADPAIFYTMAALNRLFNVGGVFHSEDGLHARPLGPNQRRCAEAFVRGSRVWPNDNDRLTYLNVGHSGSPIVSATFNEGDLSRPGCTRSYSGVIGNHGFNVTLGISDMANPGAQIGNGWRWGAEIGREQGVIVREVLR
jgi:hypothetical protein